MSEDLSPDSPVSREYPTEGALALGETWPKLPERHVSGVGDWEIPFGSYEWRASLVYFRDNDILVKGHPSHLPNHNFQYTPVYSDPTLNPAHYIHPRLVQPLTRLADLIKEADEDLRLRITSAHRSRLAELGQRNPNSLHHAGRAVDLTVYDLATRRLARSAYGWMARLAIDVGFDWVWYENETHVHVSMAPSDSAMQLQFYDPELGGLVPAVAVPLSRETDAWNIHSGSVSLQPGSYLMKFVSEEGDHFGFRTAYRLGVDHVIDHSLGYAGSAILVEAWEPTELSVRIDPERLEYRVLGRPVSEGRHWFLNGLVGLFSE